MGPDLSVTVPSGLLVLSLQECPGVWGCRSSDGPLPFASAETVVGPEGGRCKIVKDRPRSVDGSRVVSVSSRKASSPRSSSRVPRPPSHQSRPGVVLGSFVCSLTWYRPCTPRFWSLPSWTDSRPRSGAVVHALPGVAGPSFPGVFGGGVWSLRFLPGVPASQRDSFGNE